MLIHPWDAMTKTDWQAWLAEGRDFGTLIANGITEATGEQWPIAVPTHFVYDAAGDDPGRLLIHLARPNPIREAIARNPQVTVSVIGDEAYIPSYWRVDDGQAEDEGVPTSYYSAVQFHGLARLIDDAPGKARLLQAQLAHFQPEGRHGKMSPTDGPYHRMLSGMFGVAVDVTEVRGKRKAGGNKSPEHRARVAAQLAARAAGEPGRPAFKP